MPEPKLTLNQQLACDFRRNLYVCAGAGSGKTEVLTQRVIHILRQHRLELSRILVVTFTDKAASQMRARVYQAIQQQISLGDKHQPYWLKLKENFYSNSISTFHSFCAFILRDYALEAQIDPDFGILSEHEQRDLLTQVIEDEIDRLASQLQSSPLSCLSKHMRRKALVANLVRLIEARSQTAEWMDRFSSLSLEQYMTRLEDYRRQAIAEQIDDLRHSRLFWEYLDRLNSVRQQLDNKTKTETEKLAGIETLYPQLKQLDQLSAEAGVELLAKLYEQLGLVGVKNHELKQMIKGLRELLKDSQIFDYNIEPALEHQGYELLSALAPVGQQCLKAYQWYKQKDASLDFEDLQLLTLRLLQDEQHPHIRQELQARFRYIMVDEFQDTNPLQWQILRILASHFVGSRSVGSDEQGLKGDKLFMVGDEKQSIYAFRGADVTLFARARYDLRQANLKHNTHRLPFELSGEYAADYARLSETQRQRLLQGEVSLERNFRSAKGVIDFLNPFFEQLFQREHYRLYDAQPQAQTAERRFPGARVELMLVEKGKVSHFVGSPIQEQIDDYLKEAHLIAKKIKHILGARPVEYSQVLDKLERGEPAIAILLVRRNKLKVYEEALRREEIDFLVSRGRGFYQRQEIIDMINTLEFINQPQLDIPLAGVLRSPLIGLSDDGLFALASHCVGSLAGNSLWDKLCSLFEDGIPDDWPAGLPLCGLPSSDIQLLPLAFRLLRSWVGLGDRLPLSELISKLLDDSQVYICLARGPRGPQNLANIEKLIELARGFEASGRGGLWEWVNFLKTRIEQGGDEGEAEVEPALGGAVQLMTIHQAKGLEFPLVFVPDLSAPFQGKGRNNLLMDNLYDGNPQSGNSHSGNPHSGNPHSGERKCWEPTQWELGIKAPNPKQQFKPQATLIRKIIAHQHQQKNLAERRRLLYVAATRAQDHLILVGQLSPKPALQARCWQDWIRNILGLDSLAGLQSVSITNHHGEQINLPLTWFDPQEGISPYQESEVINPEQINQQVKQLAPSPKLDRIIQQQKPLHMRERPVFSPTSLLEYRRCPRRYYYRHYLRMPEGGHGPLSFSKESQAPNLAALRGSIVHSLLEEGQAPFFEARINNLLPDGISDEQCQGLKNEVKRHINQIQGSQAYQQWSKLKERSYQELGFKLEVGDFYLQGIIDQLHLNPQRDDPQGGGWVVVDYKTNELANEGEIEAVIKHEGYDFQLKCYCWAASRLLGQPVSIAQLLFSHFPHLEEMNFSHTTLEELEAEVVQLGNMIIAQEFDPRPQDEGQCLSCSYQQAGWCIPKPTEPPFPSAPSECGY